MSGLKDVLRSVKGSDGSSRPRFPKGKARFPGTMAPLRPQLHGDTYMMRVEVEDHIIPIWEEGQITSGETEPVEAPDADLHYSYSLESFIKRASIATEESVSSYDGEFSRLSESDLEEHEIRGVYLDEVPSAREQPGLLDPDCHPVYIDGVPIHDGSLTCVDMSPYADQFEIHEYEWFVGIDYNCANRYNPNPVGTGRTLKIPFEAIGKHVFCRAHRRVEIQTIDKRGTHKAKVYDPHVNIAKNAGYLPEPQFYDISSWCIVGPVFMSDEWSLELLECLSEGVYRIDAHLRFDDDLTREISSKPVSGDGSGPVKLTIDFQGLTLKDMTNNDDTRNSVANLHKLYSANVFGGADNSATLGFEDFEVRLTIICLRMCRLRNPDIRLTNCC